MAWIRTLTAVCVLALVPAAAWAQATATTGQIEGTVSDQSGGVLPGVSVTVRNPDTGFTRTAVSDEGGLYRLSLLPLGTYDLTAELQGFRPVQQTGLTLSVGETKTVPIQMGVATVQEAVTVSASQPLVEITRSLPAVTIDERAIQTLPINGRRFQDFLLMTPGAVIEPERQGTSINGQRGINAAFNIDGTSWDNPFFGGIKGGERSFEAYTISQEVIKEFQVNNAGYSAEFGRSAGGVMNAVTKSGTNALHGSGFWFFRNEGMVADDSFGRPPTDFKQHQFGATLGGPVVRDQTHYFVAYDQQVKTQPLIVEFSGPDKTAAGIPGFEGKAGSFDQTNDIWTFFGRLDQQVNQDNTAWVRYNWSKNEGKNGLGTSPTNFSTEASALELDKTHTLVGSWTSVLTPTMLNEARFQFGREDRPRQPNTQDVTITVTGLGTIGRRTFLPSLEVDDRYQFIDNFTMVSGQHSIRLGTDVNLLKVAQPFFLNRSGGEYRFRSIADYLATLAGARLWQDFRQGFGRPDVEFWQKEYAFYVQDTWSVRPNMTVNFGLRYDAQINPQPDEPNPALPGSDRIPSDKNNWGPRAGFSWSPWGDGRGVVRANAGLYYSRTPALLMVSPITTNGVAAFLLTFTPTSAGAPTFPNILASRPTGSTIPRSDVNIFSDDFQNPRTFQSSIGVEREVWTNTTLGAEFIFSDSDNMQRMFDANLPPASGTAPDGRLLYVSAQNPRPNPGFNRILRSEDTARARYAGLVLSARRRWTGGDQWYNRGLQFQANYTYGRAKDDDSNERNFSATFYQDWQNLEAEYTWALTDVRHNFGMNATWLFGGDVQVAMIQSARSGRPYSLTSTSDINGDGTFDQDRLFVNGVDSGRNSFRHPNYYRTDVKVTKILRLGGAREAEFSLDVFNLFDNANRFVSTRNRNFLNNAQAGVPDEQIGGSRQGQVSLRFRF
jgi:hypothetical protein